MTNSIATIPEPQGEDPLETFLLRLRHEEGRLIAAESNKPLLLDDPQYAYVVYSGSIDLFATRMRDGQITASRQHLVRLEAGQGFFGLEPVDGEHDDAISVRQAGVVAVGLPETRVIRVQRERLEAISGESEWADLVARMVADWVDNISQGVIRSLSPQDPLLLDPGSAVSLHDGDDATARRGVVWVTAQSSPHGLARFAGRRDVPSMPSTLPVADGAWIQAVGDLELTVTDTATILRDVAGWQALRDFHHLCLHLVEANLAVEESAELEQLETRAAASQAAFSSALEHVASLLDPARARAPVEWSSEGLPAVCERVARAAGINTSGFASLDPEQAQSVHEVGRLVGFRVREVRLQGEWWKNDGGPMVGFLIDGGPVAIVPTGPGKYALWEPGGATIAITADVAARVSTDAFTVYRPFPAGPVTIWSMLRFGVFGLRRDLLTIAVAGVVGGIIGLAPPIAMQFIFDQAVPYHRRDQLLAVGFVLLAVALSMTTVNILRSIALLRLEGKMDNSIQAALWDRLLSLPVPFFRQYSAGDLGTRAMGINAIREIISGTVANALLTGIFSVFNLVLMMYYDPLLGLVGGGLVLLVVAATAGSGLLQMKYQRKIVTLEGAITSQVLQMLNGIAKIRLVGGEKRAFALWADKFTEQRRLTYDARKLQQNVVALNAMYPVLALLVLFAVLGATSNGGLSVGEFVAFNAAFAQVLVNALIITGSLVNALAIIPIYERARPILHAQPEVDESRASPGDLSGAIEVSHVSFRYDPEGQQILHDVTMRVKAGEFVAVVGPSGSGKSTLLRLLLGFDTAESGSVYYDGKDLSSLDPRQVRRQIGTVLQNGKVMTGLVLQNIIGTSLLTIDDAWEAARLAGIGDDIKRMPMGMFTMVSEGGSTFSGGQRQRLLIARALARKPRLVFFDEATSSLDNATQEIVSRSMEELRATRVVIAHRLSTIVHADRIYVMDKGRVVQCGTYAELMSQPGLFANMARRQVT